MHNLYLEGAGWDDRNLCLREPLPLEAIAKLPAIHFLPVEGKRRLKGTFASRYIPFGLTDSGTRFVFRFISEPGVLLSETERHAWRQRVRRLVELKNWAPASGPLDKTSYGRTIEFGWLDYTSPINYRFWLCATLVRFIRSWNHSAAAATASSSFRTASNYYSM